MIEKVVRLERLAHNGYRLLAVDPLPGGGVVVCIGRRGRVVRLRFEHFEVPAVLHLTGVTRSAS